MGLDVQEQVHRLTTRLAEAEVADAARVKPVEESTVIPAAVANELVVDQWVRLSFMFHL